VGTMDKGLEAPAMIGSEEAASWSRSGPVAGAFWVLISVALFAGLAVGSRQAIELGYHSLEVVFLRNFSALLLMLPLFMWRGTSLLHSRAIGLYGVRVAISFTSMTAWFYALSLIPLGEITAIGFLSPLFGTICAVLFLGEKVRARRVTALIIGFVGAMIILRPGSASLGLGQLCALVSAVSGGVISVLLKRLVVEDDPDKIVFLTTLIMTPMSLIPALFVWRWPGLELLVPLLLVAFTGVFGHAALMRAYRATDASLIMTFDFARLPFVVGIGYLMFGELIDRWTWLGAAIIVGSAAYISHREAQLRRLARG
jgi:drug/metabolite transporter (DMT)-like permease